MIHDKHHLWELRIAPGVMCVGCEETPAMGTLVGRTSCGDGWFCLKCLATIVRDTAFMRAWCEAENSLAALEADP